jgi:hypothetical protein
MLPAAAQWMTILNIAATTVRARHRATLSRSAAIAAMTAAAKIQKGFVVKNEAFLLTYE